MKNIIFLSLICVLCIVFSLFSPVLAVNRAPGDSETPNAQSDTETKETEEDSSKDYYAGADVVKAPEISARNALLMDLDSGVVYYSRDPDARAYPASLTKILTVLLAVEARCPCSRYRSGWKTFCTPPCSGPATKAPT